MTGLAHSGVRNVGTLDPKWLQMYLRARNKYETQDDYGIYDKYENYGMYDKNENMTCMLSMKTIARLSLS